MAQITLKQSGESPEFGTLTEGAEMTVPDLTAKIWKDRGVCDVLEWENPNFEAEYEAAQNPAGQEAPAADEGGA